MADTYLALDLEMNQPSRKIIQVGVAIGELGAPDGAFCLKEWLINPEEPIAQAITALTGIADSDIEQRAVPWAQMVQELAQLIDEHKPFMNPVTWGGGDSELLLSAIRERGLSFPYFGRRWIDVKTWATCRALAEGRSVKGGLASVMGRYALHFKGTPHRADTDAFNTLRLFFKMLEQQRELNSIVTAVRNLR